MAAFRVNSLAHEHVHWQLTSCRHIQSNTKGRKDGSLHSFTHTCRGGGGGCVGRCCWGRSCCRPRSCLPLPLPPSSLSLLDLLYLFDCGFPVCCMFFRLQMIKPTSARNLSLMLDGNTSTAACNPRTYEGYSTMDSAALCVCVCFMGSAQPQPAIKQASSQQSSRPCLCAHLPSSPTTGSVAPSGHCQLPGWPASLSSTSFLQAKGP